MSKQNRCVAAGAVVSPSRPMPNDPSEHAPPCMLAAVGCNRLRCGQCGAMVRWHESPLRLVVVVLCYVMVLVGMTLVLSPFQFRKFVERRVGSDGACRGCGAALLVVAAVLAAVGMVCG